MEFFGSIDSISGSVTASAFTGSFVGDGSGLYGIPASGVTGLNLTQLSNGSATAVLSTTGFTVNRDTIIRGGLTVTGSIIAQQYIVSSSVTYMTTSYASGSSAFGNDFNDVHQFTGSVDITGSISLNGNPIGTGKLDEATFNIYTGSARLIFDAIETATSSLNSFSASAKTRLNALESTTSSLNTYTSSNDTRLSGIESTTSSLNSFTSSIDTTIKNKMNTDNVISGSIQVVLTGTTGYSTYSSSVVDLVSSSVNSLSGSVTTTVNNLSSSVGTISSSINTTIGNVSSSVSTSIGSLSSSVATTTSDLSSSVGSLSSSVATTTSGLSSSIGSISSSLSTTDNNLSSSIGLLSSSIATTDLGIKGRLNSIEGVTGSYATTGSNTFKGTQNISGSIVPTIDSAFDLGDATHQFRHLYLSSASLYIDGNKVLGSTSQELQITTTTGQSIKILEDGTDNITLQSADGDIELKSSGGGDILIDPTSGLIDLRGTIQIQDGNKFRSSGGNQITFGDDVTVTGSLRVTGNIQGIDLLAFSSSVSASLNSSTTNLTSLSSSVSSSIGALSGSIATPTSRLSSSIGSLSSSVATTDANQNTRLDNLETSTSSLNSFTSSINTTIDTELNAKNVVSGSSQITISNTTGYNTFSSSISSSIGALSSSVATTDANQNTKISNLETASGSLNSFTSSIDTTIKNKLNTEAVVSGSVQINITGTTGYSAFSSSVSASVGALSASVATTTNNLSSSVATTDLNQNNRLNSIEGVTGSYATTGSNIFQGNQTITGSLYVSQNLVVQGSSSILYVTSSQLRIDDNIITLNTSTPGARFGGIEVYDSGSVTQATGSILWDSVNNRWIYQQSSEATYGGGVLMSGPRSSGSLGSELTLTSQRIAKSVGGDHLNDSNITDNGTIVSINSNTEVTGTLVITGTILSQGTSLVSGSSQVLNGSGVWSGSAQLPSGVVSGSSQVLNGSTVWSSSAQLPSGVVSGSSQVLNGSGVWSGSAQLPSGVVSGSSQVLNGTTIHSGSFFNGISVVSGSSQITFSGLTGVPLGLVSGSSQVLNGSGVWSGSAQLPSGVISGSSQVVSSLPAGTVSGSSQVTFSGLTGVPSGLVSGSSQIAFGSISGVPSGLVSGSSQVLSGTGIWSGSAQLPSGVVSGSSQVSFGSISGVPSGLVSGSSQITFGSISSVPSGLVSGSSQVSIASTTGFGTYINQALLTTSSPSFAGLTSTAAFNITTTSTQPVVISGDTATNAGVLFRIQTAEVNDSFATGKRTFLGDGGADIIIGTANSSYTPGNTYMALNHSGEISMGAGSATKHFTLSTGGNLTISGTIGASNFSGTSSGTNTGDQTNISGNAATVSNGVYTNVSNTITGGRLIVGYAETSEPFVNAHFYNTSTQTSTQYGGALVSGINQAHIRFQVGTNTWGASGAKQWQIRVGNGGGEDNMKIYSWTYGADVMTLSSNAAVTFAGAITASNFSGSHSGTSSGTNTGDVTETLATVTGRGASTSTSTSFTGGLTSYAGATKFGYTSYASANTAVQIKNSSYSYAHKTYDTLQIVQDDVTTLRLIEYNNGGTNQMIGLTTGDGNSNVLSSQNLKFYTNASPDSITLYNGGSGNLAFSLNGAGNMSVGPSSNYTTQFNVAYGNYNQMNVTYGSASGWGLLIGYGDGTLNTGYHGSNHAAIVNVQNGPIHFGTNNSSNVQLSTGGHLHPSANNTYDLGTSSLAWRNVYTNDLHLSNMNKPEGNDIDGTSGNWTIQEGAENLYIINNNNGKKFRIKLEEI